MSALCHLQLTYSQYESMTNDDVYIWHTLSIWELRVCLHSTCTRLFTVCIWYTLKCMSDLVSITVVFIQHTLDTRSTTFYALVSWLCSILYDVRIWRVLLRVHLCPSWTNAYSHGLASELMLGISHSQLWTVSRSFDLLWAYSQLYQYSWDCTWES